MRDTSTLVRANTATDVKVDICLMPLALAVDQENFLVLGRDDFLLNDRLSLDCVPVIIAPPHPCTQRIKKY